jgi:tRNA modification GTPase
MNDTIFALATAPGRAAVAVIRLSGPAARGIVRRLAKNVPKARIAALRTLYDAEGRALDRGLVLWFSGPHSYTGEDCAEFHIHGGAAIVDGLTRALMGAGARLANPGEFTRRAFETGKLDLGQAEAVADLIDAETQSQARQAIDQLGGELGRRYETWRERLIAAMAMLEAGVDFPDEELPADVALAARQSLESVIADLDAGLSDRARGQRIREGYRVAIIGAPNAGKSSLLNELAGRSAAIVTATPGATRDVIEIPLVLAGYKVLLADMAGIRDTLDPIEAEGVRRAIAWATQADLRLWIVDAADSDGAWASAASLVRKGDLCLLNKMDLPPGRDRDEARTFASNIHAEIVEASVTIDPAAIGAWLTRRVVADLTGSDFPAATRARHAAHLAQAHGHLVRALAILSSPELAAEDVRLAARALERITGRIGAEDVLDRVFATFCIGK